MTQGTKIGLLVSLAFLIVVFVLLSDHVANTSDAKPAVVTSAGPQVEKAIATPGTAVAPTAEPAAADVAVGPRETVTTGGEMAQIAQPPAVSNVVVGPAQTGATNVTSSPSTPTNRIATPVPAGSDARVLVMGQTRDDAVLPPGFVPVMRSGPSDTQPLVAAPKAQEHKAMPGDTVAKMAKAFYGADTKANRDLIVSANKSLKGDPNRIEVGKVYTIPSKPGAPASVAAAVGTAIPVAAPTTKPAATADAAPAKAGFAAPAAPERVYVVKEGDNLWKIAREQCKDAAAVDQIKKLNRDVLKNGIDLKVGTKLKLPPVTKEV